jgi:DNA-directed RNA polymerase subunit beta
MSTIPGFSQIQFEGFCRFINKALAEELDKFPIIKDPYDEIFLPASMIVLEY